MSIGAWRAALAIRGVGGLTKLVLLVLADRASPEGVAFGRVAGLAEACGISKRSAQRCLRELEVRGLLGTEERVGRTSIFRLCLPLEVPGKGPIPVQRHLPLLSAVGAQPVDKAVGIQGTKGAGGDSLSSPRASLSPLKPYLLNPKDSSSVDGVGPSLGITRPDEAFATWWALWPWRDRSRRWAAEGAWSDTVARAGGAGVLIAALSVQVPVLRGMHSPPEAVGWLMGRWWAMGPADIRLREQGA